ncbi:ubiquinol-cytochrome c reductase iron-sulfur subunit N-terminal domain-containing protein, partial [Vibrio parahaemolyticus]
MSNAPLNNGRRRFLTATTAVVGGLGAVAVAVPFIKSWNPSAKAKAAGAPVEV